MPAHATSTAVGLAVGVLLDAAFGDPRRGHPVAGFGAVAGRLERAMHADDRARGVAYTALCVGTTAALGLGLRRAVAGRPLATVAVTAGCTWAVLGGTTLRREARLIAAPLVAGDLPAARAALPRLVGRDPARLDDKGIARAVVESVAENTSDAVVAPLFWGAVAGIPGLLGYRAINTLDAMVGHHTPRHENFGWASARLDDAANWLPARLTGLLTVAVAPVVGGDRARAWAVLRRDGGSHPSPNAGRCEASAAGALDVALGGRNVYAGRTEDRPRLGDGPPPSPTDIDRANRLSATVGLAAAAPAVAFVAARAARRTRGTPR
ncbi:cobalamin biosynthesis protein [Embleya sp. NBC_00888]|uniref:cobalamin biosynthesis protein n=1 Tax=Embleya sp. NBC_00888 TaxID=2975960 RepID=UPI00386A9AAD|nr:cobalamin biosynthesis protein [Embleya sp. NBC_00888]